MAIADGDAEVTACRICEIAHHDPPDHIQTGKARQVVLCGMGISVGPRDVNVEGKAGHDCPSNDVSLTCISSR